MSARGRHYEFAEHGRETYDVSAGRTHGSAPMGNREDGQKFPTIFGVLMPPCQADEACFTATLKSLFMHCIGISL